MTRKPIRRDWWATVRGTSVCLWTTRADARQQADPDERVARVRVTEIAPKRRPGR